MKISKIMCYWISLGCTPLAPDVADCCQRDNYIKMSDLNYRDLIKIRLLAEKANV